MERRVFEADSGTKKRVEAPGDTTALPTGFREVTSAVTFVIAPRGAVARMGMV
jgi:hypothetical protein